jgi:hypothetical protein
MRLIKTEYMKGLYENMNKIRINVYINKKMKEMISIDQNKDLLEIDIGLDDNKNMIHVIYMRNMIEMLKWKKLLDIFLNQWTND